MTNEEFKYFFSEQGWSADDFAEITGCSRAQVFKWRKGDYPVPKYIELVCELIRLLPRKEFKSFEKRYFELSDH